jgi:hypothetical protein
MTVIGGNRWRAAAAGETPEVRPKTEPDDLVRSMRVGGEPPLADSAKAESVSGKATRDGHDPANPEGRSCCRLRRGRCRRRRRRCDRP